MPTHALFILLFIAGAASGQPDSRKRDLEVLQNLLLPSRPAPTGRVTPHEKTWEEYIRRTGELPPDFAQMPSNAGLPDPLLLQKGNEVVPVTTLPLWEEQKQWIRKETEKWIFGTMPPKPDNLQAEVLSVRREGTATVRDVLLQFGPQHKGRLRLQLIIPDGKGPFPVFLTNHARNRPWLYTAVNRGYIACVYYATDPNYGSVDDSDAFMEVYPEYSFSTLARWGWSAARAVDYLYMMAEVDKQKIGVTGHSRNGKQALVAAAFDERIGAVVLSSGLTGEALPWRYTSDPWVVESVELLTGAQPHWFHPHLRFFAGREHKLPVDHNMLIASIAPRGVMIYSAYAEAASNPVALEKGYRSALRAYEFLDKKENIWLHLRAGEHGTAAGDIENFMDFFDSVFGRKPRPKSETWIHGYDFEEWKKKTGVKLDATAYPVRTPGDFVVSSRAAWEQKKPEIRQRLISVLGEEPAHLPAPQQTSIESGDWEGEGWLGEFFKRPRNDASWKQRLGKLGMGHAPVAFGDGLSGSLFYPAETDGKPKGAKWPVVIWLHPYSYATGWSARQPWSPTQQNFVLDQRPSFDSLIRRGFAVFAFDQIGHGSRIHDARDFYDRYPRWSLLGRMVSDTRAAITAMSALKEVDASQIHLMGYSLGAKVALWTAALDDRPKSVVSISGFDPLRLSGTKETEGLQHYSHIHGLLPKLGFFVGQESRIPFDYDEILALAAPRKVLLVAPQLDRYAPVNDVRLEVEAVRKIYGLTENEKALVLETPEDFNRFPRQLQERVFDWLAGAKQVALRP